MTEYKIVKSVLIGDELHKVESHYSKYGQTKAVMAAWSPGDTDLDGNEILKIELYEIEDGKETRLRTRAIGR